MLRIELNLRAARRALALAAGMLLLSGTAAGLVALQVRDQDVADALLRLEPGAEGSPLAWFGSVLLLLCALLLGALADRARTLGLSRWRAWLGLALLFVALSIDEIAAIHESLRGAWLALALLVIAVAGAMAWPVWRSRPGDDRRAWVLAAALFVGGALGVDELTEVVLEGTRLTTARVLFHAAEEAFEMAGAIVFITSLLHTLARPPAEDPLRE